MSLLYHKLSWSPFINACIVNVILMYHLIKNCGCSYNESKQMYACKLTVGTGGEGKGWGGGVSRHIIKILRRKECEP